MLDAERKRQLDFCVATVWATALTHLPRVQHPVDVQAVLYRQALLGVKDDVATTCVGSRLGRMGLGSCTDSLRGVRQWGLKLVLLQLGLPTSASIDKTRYHVSVLQSSTWLEGSLV